MIINDLLRQQRVLAGSTKTWWERHLLAERDTGRLRQACQKRSIKETRGNRHHTNTIGCEVTGNRQCHADNPALRGRVCCLSDLTIERSHRGCVDDDATLTFLVRSAMTTFAPACASNRTHAAPRPEAPPVTKTPLFVSSIRTTFLYLCCPVSPVHETTHRVTDSRRFVSTSHVQLEDR